MKRVSIYLGIAAAAGSLAAGAPAPAAEREGEAGSARPARFRGTIKAIDARTGRFIVPVVRGRDGDPNPRPVDVLVITAAGTRFVHPAREGGQPAAAARFQDLTPGLLVNISGVIAPDGSVSAREVTLFQRGGEREDGGRRSPEAEAGARRSPEAEAGARRPAEGERPRVGPREGERPRDGDRPRTGARDGERPQTGPRDGERPRVGPRDGERPATGPREGDQPRVGAREGERPRSGPRDGERPQVGARDGERPRTGPRDGERPQTGPRDGERPQVGPRDGDAPRGGERERGRGEEADDASWLRGTVLAVNAQRGTFMLEWRSVEEGVRRTSRSLVTVGPRTRYVRGAAAGEGQAPMVAFRDIQVGSQVYLRGTQGAESLQAAEIRVFPAGRAGAREGEGQRSPETGRERQP